MNRRLREGLGWLFLASLLLLVIVWGVRLLGNLGGHTEPLVDVQLFVAAPGGGLRIEEARIKENELNAPMLWARLQEVSQKSPNSVLPPDAKLQEVRQEDSVLVASFSGELAKGRYLGSNEEIALVYSIVNTLAQLPDVESVRILIEGITVESLADHVDLTAPLSPDPTIVVE
ncbi:MAG: GerMN domain-containing protein [Firmicutes bacterium]|nr:GerMN domain-containing protein [Bacillota bacterium]